MDIGSYQTMQSSGLFEPRISWRDFAPVFVVVFNSLVWFTLTYAMFNSAVSQLALTSSESLMIFTMYYVGVACSAILGAMFFSRARETCLLLWMLAGAGMTGILVTVFSNDFAVNSLVSLCLGISIGVGLPSSLACFADLTSVEHRGAYGGLLYGFVALASIVLIVLLGALEPTHGFVLLAVWRILGFVAFFFLRSKNAQLQKRRPSSYRDMLSRRDVLLYLVPWIMFSLVNFTEAPILEEVFDELFVLVGFLEVGLSGFFVVIGGMLSDLVGRKRVVITGFVVLGIEYAVLSLFSEMDFAKFLYAAFDSFAWGMFASVFFMTLWGDLAMNEQREKYYAVGGLPYLLAGYLSILVQPHVGSIGTVAAFSLASFFLFLAVLPLMYAPETLPEKKIIDRQLRDYIDKAKKAKGKYA